MEKALDLASMGMSVGRFGYNGALAGLFRHPHLLFGHCAGNTHLLEGVDNLCGVKVSTKNARELLRITQLRITQLDGTPPGSRA